jgi:hypothetical protein
MGDLKSPRAICFKGCLFFVAGLMASLLLVARDQSWITVFLLVVSIWSFCRFYYFLFYVVEHYVDRNAHYSGLIPMLMYLWITSSHQSSERAAPESNRDRA